MRISHEVKNTQQVDYMSLISDFQEKYSSVYWNTIDGQIYIYRSLGRIEYKELISSDAEQLDKEDAVCKTCLLYPYELDLDECPAGLPTEIFRLIMKNSFLDTIDSKKLIVAYYRREMQVFDNQITCIINEAFPNFDIEDIENWDMAKTAKYLSRAEWKLNVLRQIPIDFDKSDELMENEWVREHSNEDKEEENIEEDTPVTESNENNGELKIGETLEERHARLKKEGPKRRSPEELERLKRAFPDIDWGAEVNPTGDLSNMQENVDVVSPALRC